MGSATVLDISVIALVSFTLVYYGYKFAKSKNDNVFISDVVLLVLVVALVLCYTIIICKKKTKNVEEFVDLPLSLKELGITSLKEANNILSGSWSEDTSKIGPKELLKNLNLYYSSFSELCRSSLQDSPYIWMNLSPYWKENLPKALCQLEDNKIIFSNRPISTELATQIPVSYYTVGFPLAGVKANGPKGMNLGISNYNGAQSQSFTIFSLVKFGTNPESTNNNVIFKSWANTPVNIGVNLSFNASSDNHTPVYNVTFSLQVVDKVQAMNSVVIDISNYYLLVMTYEKVTVGYEASFNMWELDISKRSHDKVLSQSGITYQEVIDFSNKQIELGDFVNKTNPISLLTFGVYNTALRQEHMKEMTLYYLETLNKLSAKSCELYRLFTDFHACPFIDTNLCDKCDGVDWTNPSSILQSNSICKLALAQNCNTNPSAFGCECFSEEAIKNETCSTWKSMLQGKSTCSFKELNDFKNLNCSVDKTISQETLESNKKFNFDSRMYAKGIIDFYNQQLIEVKNKRKQDIEKSFFEWLFGMSY
jgi:hypothetical protein